MAAVKWRCPVPACPVERERPGMCQPHLVQLIRAEPAPPPEEPAAPTVALDCPWGQLVEVGPDGLAVGRESPAFRGGGIAAFDQVSRLHARLAWKDGELLVDDLQSYNGTYVDGVEVVPGQPVAVRPGQELRLGLDVSCRLVELNEFGEPR